MIGIKPPNLPKIWRFSFDCFQEKEFSKQTIYDTIIVKSKESANMGYDAYQKEYTELEIKYLQQDRICKR